MFSSSLYIVVLATIFCELFNLMIWLLWNVKKVAWVVLWFWPRLDPNWLKCGFLKKSFIMNAPLWVEHLNHHFLVGLLCCTHQKVMRRCSTHKGAFIINPHFRSEVDSDLFFTLLLFYCPHVDYIGNDTDLEKLKLWVLQIY